MKIISKRKTKVAIIGINEVRDIIISYINADDNVVGFSKPILVDKVKAIANNVADVLKFGRSPFKCLTKLECYYVHECMHNYKDLSDYYLNQAPKYEDMHKALKLVSLCLSNICSVLELVDGMKAYHYFMLWNEDNIENHRSIAKIEALLFVNNYNTFPWIKPIKK